MNILINLSTLKKGGGQNVALNFLESFSRIKENDHKIVFVVVNGSELDNFLKTRKYPFILYMPANPILRMIKEVFTGGFLIKKYSIDVIYTYFGVGLYPRNIPQISGSADSNIYFPEIDFWSSYTGLSKMIKVLIDKYRIWGLKRMTAIIYENKSMLIKGKELFGVKNSIFIKPSININYFYKDYYLPSNINQKSKKGLFLCGWQKNKNYEIIPLIAAILKKMDYDFHFIFTAPMDNSTAHLEFKQLLIDYDVTERISIIGGVKKEEIQSLYKQIDVVFLLSKLESFSNNIIEAWHFKKPLIISDDLWAKSICMDAAVYVNRDDEKEISSSIIEILENKDLRELIISNGNNMIGTYPSIDERTEKELDYIRYIYETN